MKRILFLLVLSLVATAALAHDSWIAPDDFAQPCGAVTLHMTSGMEFGKLDYAIDPARVARAVIMTPGQRLNMTPKAAAHSLDFQVDVPKGESIVAVDLAPKTLDLTPAQVSEYLDEIGASDDIRAAWKAHPGRWRESYTKHAKTLLRCGDADHRFQTGADMGFELVPQGTDPTTLKPGDKFSVALVGPGHLFRDVPLVLVREGTGRVAVIQPDNSGVESFVIKEPGRYMLSATHLRRADGKDVDWKSDFTTLTFEVK
jgi:hypothetical protein